MGNDSAQANPRMILQNRQQAREPARIDFTKRFMGRHGQDEAGLYLKNVGFGNRSWTGLVGRGWSPTEITIAILEQNGGYAHVCHTPGMGTYIDWLITPEGKKIGNDGSGGLQFYVNRSLPFIVRDGKAVWLNADNPVLMENDVLEWKYDPYTQEMPDILGKKKGGGGCMGGSNVTDLTNLRVRLFGGYDPSAEMITMLPPLPDAKGQALAWAQQTEILNPVIEHVKWNYAQAANIVARPETTVSRELEMHSFWSKPAEIAVKGQRRDEKPLRKQEGTGAETLFVRPGADLQFKPFLHAPETVGLDHNAKAAGVRDAFVPMETGIRVSAPHIHQDIFEGGPERLGAGNEAKAAAAAAPENFWVPAEPASRTGQGAAPPGRGRSPRKIDAPERGRDEAAEEKKERSKEAREKKGVKEEVRKETREKAPAAEKPKGRRGKKNGAAPNPLMADKKERATLMKAVVPDKRTEKSKFRRTAPAVELKIIGLKKEKRPVWAGKAENARKKRVFKEERKGAVAAKRRAGRKRRQKKGRGIEYLLMRKAKGRKRRNWLALSKR